MRIVKNILPFIIALMLLSCSKDTVIQTANYITAGEKEGVLLVYKDFEPDDSMTFTYPSTYLEHYLDINSDSYHDIVIIMNTYVSPGNQNYSFSVKALNTHTRFMVSTQGTANADTLREGKRIDKTGPWSDTLAVLSAYNMMMQQGYHSSGMWNNAGEKYLGFRYATSTDTLYGWIRAKISNNTSIIIKDMAYKFPKR